MTGLVQAPGGGWYRPGPTHCRLGHRLLPGKHVTGWDGAQRPYWYCEQDGHDDHASRWVFLTGPQQPSVIPANTPDHGHRG